MKFCGRDPVQASDREIRKVRGGEIGVIFQEPMAALNPVHRIGRQVSEVFRIHKKLSQKDAWAAATEMLQLVRIPAPEKRMMDYPHHLSGGMRQRVVIAMALACKPSSSSPTKPTTALDVTVQAHDPRPDGLGLQAEMGMSTIFITHDLGVIAETCDDVVVMQYAYRVVERASAEELFGQSPPRLHQGGRFHHDLDARHAVEVRPQHHPPPAWSLRWPHHSHGCRSCQRMAAPRSVSPRAAEIRAGVAGALGRDVSRAVISQDKRFIGPI